MAGLVKKAQGLQRFMLDCGFWRSRKWVGGGLAAIGLQACGISYSYEHGTDGRLPKDDLALALGLREKEVKAAVVVLLKRGIWSDGGDCLVIVGYQDHNPSQAEVEEHRTRKTAAGIKGNHDRWHKTKIDPQCPLCQWMSSQPDRTSESGGHPNGIAPAIPNRSESDGTTESQSRVEESRVDPPLSPFSPIGADPPTGVAGAKGEEDLEKSEEHPKLRPLAQHMAEALWPGRPRMLAESIVAVRTCLAVADAGLVDECIGAMIAADEAPHTPKYLLATVRNRLVGMGAYAPGDETLVALGGRS